jgi:RNA polymerase sigma factor (sigma-70 family)
MHPITRTMTAREGMTIRTAATHDLEALVARARTGERAGTEALLREIRPLVYRWAWVRTSDSDEADDVTQTVLLNVHRRIHRFEGRSSFTSWLYRITANAAAEQHRRRKTVLRLVDRVRRLNHPEPATVDPIARIESERTRALVSQIVESLPARQRVVFDLVDLEGFSQAEAAGMLEMNATTLRVHLMRARRAIRGRLLARASRKEAVSSND